MNAGKGRAREIADLVVFLKEKLDLPFIKAWIGFRRDRDGVLSAILSRQWPQGLHPVNFFLKCYAIFALFQVFLIPLSSPEVSWIRVWIELSTDDHQKFLKIFDVNMTPSSFRNTMFLEGVRPGSSHLSAIIRDKVGSDQPARIGNYLATIDYPLANRFSDGIARASKHNKYLSSISAVTALVAMMLMAIPLHFLLGKKRRSLWQTFHVLLYVEGWWLVLASAVSLNTLIPFTVGLPIALLVAVIYLVLVSLVIMDCVGTLRYTHHTSTTKSAVAFIAAGLASWIAAFILVGIPVQIAIRFLL